MPCASASSTALRRSLDTINVITAVSGWPMTSTSGKAAEVPLDVSSKQDCKQLRETSLVLWSDMFDHWNWTMKVEV